MTLVTFYGEDDLATLQNVLHRVPNVVPQLLRYSNIPGDDNGMDDATRNAVQCGVAEHPSRSEDDAAATVASVHVTLRPDSNGAYVNSVVTDYDEVDRHSTDSKDSNLHSRRLVRQDCAITDEDDPPARNPAEGGSDPDTVPVPLSSTSSDQDTLSHSTLHTFLRMVSTQSTECFERSELREDSDNQHTVQEVTYLLFIIFSPIRSQSYYLS